MHAKKAGGGGSWYPDGCSGVGEVEGVLWAVRAELLGVMEKMNGLMSQVDLGLGLIMGLDHGLHGPCILNPPDDNAIGPKENVGCDTGLSLKNNKASFG